MKIKTSLFLTVLLIFICCIGAASAAEDISDDAISTDSDLGELEQTDDATLEVNNEEEVLSTVISQPVSTWADLKSYSQSTTADYEITVANGTYNVGSDSITFGNNAKIIGSGNTVITGGSSSVIPFQGTGKSITFSNLIFRNMNSDMVIKLVDSGSSKIENCVFENIVTSTSGQKSVVYNNGGYMKITSSNFTNCNTTYGVITNHKTPTTALMDIENCRFEYNIASQEPGAINNCGIMNITDSVFNYNRAALWAGAIHTHTNAKSVIKRCSFTGNIAGWNGGALYTYATLEVFDSNFTDNNCSTNNGGGAIGASNYFFASNAYNVKVNNCKFVDNNNLHANGYGGAIAAMNGGTLNVNGSTFIHNSATTGQAIAGFNTKDYANISEGKAHLVITHNTFINHTGTSTTVYISGNQYTFDYNTFINSPQTVYSGTGNVYNSAKSSYSNAKKEILGASYIEILADEHPSSDQEILDILLDNLDYDDVTIYLSSGTWSIPSRAMSMSSETDVHIIGENRDNTIFTSYGITQQGSPENYKGTFTWENITFYNTGMSLYGINYKFINCKFINYTLELNAEEIPSNGGNYYLFDYSFINCEFVNYTQNVMTGHNYTNIVISNCNFENIISDTILSTTCTGSGTRYGDGWSQYTDKSSVTLKDSTFNNVDVKGIVKASADAVDNVITDNKYDFKTQKTFVDGEYTYIDVPLKSIDSNIVISNESNVVIITLSDAECNPIKGATVTYNTTSGVEGSNVTDDDGKFTIVGLTGEFTINVTYAGNESFNPSNTSVSFNFKLPAVKTTLIINSTEKGIVVITLVDNENKPIANLEVKYSINDGENSTNTTGADGTISIPVTGEGEIKAYFEGNEDYLKSENSYKYNFTETTPDTNGSSTNSTGNATSGNGTSTNTGKTDTNKQTTTKITKKATKITAKKATFKAKKKTKKYSIVLKAGKKAVKKVKVTLKVGKKTYKATTNSKGKATFKITKLNKKGKYTAVIKFAGNKNYKATSKKVRITVKK